MKSIAIVIIKIYSTFAAKHASASRRVYALALFSHTGGAGGQLHVNNGSFVTIIDSNASYGVEFDLKVRNKEKCARSSCAVMARLSLAGHCQRSRPPASCERTGRTRLRWPGLLTQQQAERIMQTRFEGLQMLGIEVAARQLRNAERE